MGRFLFRLPDIGEGIAEAEVTAWHVGPGDLVSEDQSIVDVMTDKATVEITSPVAGRVVSVHGTAGTMLAVGSVAIEFEVEGPGNTTGSAGEEAADNTGTQAPRAETLVGRPAPRMPTSPKAEREPSAVSSKPSPPPRQIAPAAAPATRRRAYEAGVPLQFVTGTGPGGRISSDDLDRHLSSGARSGFDGRAARLTGTTEVPIIGLRRAIAKQMQQASQRIPHIAYVEECDVTELEALRLDLNAHRSAGQPKLTLLPFFLRALVRAIADFPQINARYDDEAAILTRHEGVHVGIATRTQAGLVVPVLRHAEAYDLWGLAYELARVTGAVRDGTAPREDLLGSTITVTSLGTLGGIVTTPIINHPEVAIVAPNRIVEKPVAHAGSIVIRKMMNLSSSFDHRIIDGFDAASFIQSVKRMIEHPALLMMAQ